MIWSKKPSHAIVPLSGCWSLEGLLLSLGDVLEMVGHLAAARALQLQVPPAREPVLRIRDVYPGYRMRIFPFRIPDPHQRIKYLYPKHCFQALGNMIRVVHPRPRSRIQGKKAPDADSQHCTESTEWWWARLFTVVWLGSSPPPSPPPIPSASSLFSNSYGVSPVELTGGRGERSQIMTYDSEKAWSSITHSILSGSTVLIFYFCYLT